MDFVQERGTQIGALLIMRDAESVRRIGDEIEMSRRLSASGRVTGGVAHEVKNPINAIVLHFELLQNKLSELDPDTQRHMDIISREIQRLDRVVQTLVDFMRTRELHLVEVDLRRLLEEVALLAAPDAAQHNVEIKRHLPQQPLPVNADLDLIKQALLNVVMNGVQSMPEGGPLIISAYREGNAVVAEIRIAASASRKICTKRFLSSTSPPRKKAAASAWHRPTRFSTGIMARWNLNRRKARGRLSVFAFPWQLRTLSLKTKRRLP